MKTTIPKLRYKLQGGSGAACYLEPPDHPRYYVRSVYNIHGDYFQYDGAPHYYLDGNWYTELEDVDKLYKPLPLDHPRTRAWIADLFQHFQNCYRDEERQEYGRPGTLIYPLPFYVISGVEIDACLDDPDDVRYSDAHRAKCRALREAAVEKEWQRAARIATIDNHLAVRTIRKYYPEYDGRDDFKNPPKSSGQWWETHEAHPTPDTCPGEDRWSPKRPHPVNGSWCQVCGWKA